MKCINATCPYHDRQRCGRSTYHIKSANCRDRFKVEPVFVLPKAAAK